eukprot:CAMPEP_0181295858 /NCGR_PEP_ID=MMETSP1101-20121128/4377_1 /TAXON_ID=46948 /ORGANISM="Rhodomonas abbreviata, Strain Caron Lab Isolate" /LENGTH=390 /DNA_ID=CAMNT_0023400649 /DNA_START=87 /DNA_END=1259 /DNA_ORIENTATION=-
MDGGFGKNFDDPLVYRMRKSVRIRDRTLGLYYGIACVAIFIYIVGWKLGVEKAYLEYEPISGSIKLELVGSTPRINLKEEDYCRDMKCRLCDEHDVRYPNTDTREPLVTTYVREARQQRVCHRNATECPFASPFQTALWDDYLVAGVEHFNMRILHSVQAPMFYLQSQASMFKGDSRRMHGRLVGRKNGELHTLKEFPANGQADQIGIGEILQAAGVSLDHVLPGHIRPIRETGSVIFCHVRYFNDYTVLAPASDIHYEYEFSPANEVESVYEPVHLGVAWTSPVDVEERMLLTRRGVKLVWTQEGALGKFSFSALMITIAIWLALLKVTAMVGDMVATRLLPNRRAYKAAAEHDVVGDADATGLDDASAGLGWGRSSGDYGAIRTVGPP